MPITMPTNNQTYEVPRLLIVDDEMPNVELLRRVFMRGYHVSTAKNGKEALKHLMNESFDVVLLDIMMPILNGLDTLRVIRDTPRLYDMPVVLISALAASDDIATGLKLGANDYVTKPLDITVVKARVDTQTALKRLTDERKAIIARLEAANSIKTRLMQVASHDLKNPLTNLRMFHRLIQKSVSEDMRLVELLNLADQTINTMLEVIDEFLDADKMTSEALSIALEEVSTLTIVREIMSQYAATAHDKGITINAHDLQAVVIADPNRLRQVISNILSNAIKYSPPYTTVTVYSEQRDGWWRLIIADEGPGIPESERDGLFQPFSSLSTTPTAGEDSTGLGLWIVKEMMRLQQGDVGADFPVSGGSQFWIALPLAPQSAGVR